jgi:pimeloyl-ACP methyl ester carboxylesterase
VHKLMHLRKLEIRVTHDVEQRPLLAPRTLLSMIATNKDVQAIEQTHISFDHVMIYLHGFPDMAVHPSEPKMASRMPSKLATAWLEQPEMSDSRAFFTFNFGGVPGSDREMRFYDKTIGQEVEDAVAVCQYVRTHWMQAINSHLHVVGLSTGAIVASLLRRHTLPVMVSTITVMAGLVNLKQGIFYDFTPAQCADFNQTGDCWKEFYVPCGCRQLSSLLPIDTILSLDGVTCVPVAALSEGTPITKIYLRLHRRYFDETQEQGDQGGRLDIGHAVSTIPLGGKTLSPLLVIHGESDACVPVANGHELYAAAAKPKHLVVIPNANHLLTNSKHLKVALREILAHTKLSHC